MLYVPKWLVHVVMHVSLGVHVVVHVSLGVHVVCPQVAGACSGACFTEGACCMSPSGWCM